MPNPQEPPAADDVGAIIARIRELDRAATLGPWTTEKPVRDADGWPMGITVAATARGHMVYANPPGGCFPEADRHLIAEYRTLAVQLAAHVEALQADKARLDWIEAHSDSVQYNDSPGHGWIVDTPHNDDEEDASGPTLREAIDAARFPTSEGRADGE